MWHEARKQERRIRGMIVDYRKRAERRQDFYEKIQADPTQFIQVHGRRCKIHLDPAVAAAGDGAAIIVPWQGQQDNLIDRFDVRAHLDYIPPVPKILDADSVELSFDERQCNYERYRILAQNDFLNVPEEKFLHQLYLEEQYGANAQLEAERNLGKKKQQKSGSGATIGYSYDDSETLSIGPQPFSHLMHVAPSQTAASMAGAETSEKTGSDSDSEMSDIDMDVAIDITKMDNAQAHELNACGRNYGMVSNDFYSYLTKDADEADALRIAREEEQEKMLLSGRKSRRERRAQKERRIACRPFSPPSYAAKEDAGGRKDNKDEESESRSPSPADVNAGKITYITSFGGEDELQPHSKISISIAKGGPQTLGESCVGVTVAAKSAASSSGVSGQATYAQKVKENLDKFKQMDTSKRHRRSRSRCYRSRSRSHSRSRYRRSIRRRSRSRSHSHSRSHMQRRTSRRRRSSSASHSSQSAKSSKTRHTQSRKTQHTQHTRSSPPVAAVKSAESITASALPMISYPIRTVILPSAPSASATLKAPTPQVVEPPPPPLKRYYGRKRNDGDSSSASNSELESEAEKESKPDEGNDECMDVDTTSELSNPLPSSSSSLTFGKQTGKYSAAQAKNPKYPSLSNASEIKGTGGSCSLNLRERLKRKMQNLLNKQYKADKRAEIEKTERERQLQLEREDEMRELALKLRRRQRELRHRYGTPSSSRDSIDTVGSKRSKHSKSCRSSSNSSQEDLQRQSSRGDSRTEQRKRSASRSRSKHNVPTRRRSASRGRRYQREGSYERSRDTSYKDRDRERERERVRERDRDKERERDRERDTRTHTVGRSTDDRDRLRERERDRDREQERFRMRERDRDRQSDRQKDRYRDMDRERERARDRYEKEFGSSSTSSRHVAATAASSTTGSSAAAATSSSRNRVVISAPPKLKKLVDY